MTNVYNDYQDFTARTALYPTQIEREYLALGLCSETGEIATIGLMDPENVNVGQMVDETVKELGDCTWYAARLAAAHQWPFHDLCNAAIRGATAQLDLDYNVDVEEILLRLCASAGLVASVIKKQLRDGHTWSGEKRQEQADRLKTALTDHLHEIVLFAYVLNIADPSKDITFETILQHNREKLEGRQARGTIGGDGDAR